MDSRRNSRNRLEHKAFGVTRPWPHVRDAGVRSYLSARQMSAVTEIPYTVLIRWRNHGPVWVPSPDIMVDRRPGWSLPCAQHWKQLEHAPFRRPECVPFVGLRTMARTYRVGVWNLWHGIRDGSIPAPVVWVDGLPGWRHRPTHPDRDGRLRRCPRGTAPEDAQQEHDE